MEKGTTIFIILSLSSLAATSVITSSKACDNIPSMGIAAACHKVTASQRMHDLCLQLLQGSPDNGEVLAYALAAADGVARLYASTMAADDKLLLGSSISGEMKAACLACTQSYFNARLNLEDAMVVLQDCSFEDARRMFVDAIVNVDDCSSKLLPAGESTPFYGMVVTDRDRSMLAFRLAGLITNEWQAS